MKSEANDIYEMLDTLALPVAAQRFAQLSESPELGSYTALQLLREVLEPQYIETLNKRFETNLRLSSLINKGAVAENLKTGNGRIYNDATVEQVLKFHFAENRQNVGIYGVTGAGKSYFLSACCVEACKRNYRCKFVDYSDLLDELIVLNRQEDLNKYRKRIRYYARIQLLFRVISDSYESKSLILTTNLEFSKWGGIFTDDQMAAAMIDRLVHHGHLLIFEGKSYRMEHALMRRDA